MATVKLYRLSGIIELLQIASEVNNYVGFETNEKGNLEITLKERHPDWRDEDGCGEAVEVIEMLEPAGEY